MVHENQGPRFGENYVIAKRRKRIQLARVISVIAENKSHAYHKIHLHIMIVVTILILSFYGLR